MARELNMVSKHSLEKHAAHQAHCFTTVSDITARECAQLLERYPDIVTPNGFEENFVPKGAYKEKRTIARERLLKLAGSLIGYEPDVNSFLIATSGRYEYKNKGIDLFIEAVRRLKETDTGEKEIIAFVMVPAWSGDAREDLALRMDVVEKFETALPDPFVTHALYNYNDDRVMSQIHNGGFSNRPEDKVKIIFIPSYLKPADPQPPGGGGSGGQRRPDLPRCGQRARWVRGRHPQPRRAPDGLRRNKHTPPGVSRCHLPVRSKNP